jgi:hypothetical protein
MAYSVFTRGNVYLTSWLIIEKLPLKQEEALLIDTPFMSRPRIYDMIWRIRYHEIAKKRHHDVSARKQSFIDERGGAGQPDQKEEGYKH